MGTYWDAFVDKFPRQDGESDRAYLERFYSWLDAFSVPTKHTEHITDLMRQLTEATRKIELYKKTVWPSQENEEARRLLTNQLAEARAAIVGINGLLAEANERSQREFFNTEAWHAKWTEQEAKLEEAYTNVSQLQGALLAADGATVQAVRGCDALKTRLEQAREAAEAGKDLAGWAAAIKWNHQERNTAEWLAGLRVRVEKVQALAALDAGKEAGG